MTETEPATKVDRRTLNKGREVGRSTYKVYKWEVTMFDKETNQLKQGKFCSLAHINREWDLKLTCDLAHRIQTYEKRRAIWRGVGTQRSCRRGSNSRQEAGSQLGGKKKRTFAGSVYREGGPPASKDYTIALV